MDHLREWAAALCGAAVLCAGADLLAPGGRQSKGMKILLGAMVLCLVLSPAARLRGCGENIGEFISPPAVCERRLLEVVESQTSEAVRESVSGLISDQLTRMGITPVKITVETDISEDGCITIRQAEARITGGRLTPDETAGRLYENLGIKVSVTEAEAQDEYN